jgi:phosphoglycerate-specific signal transduction histidine kinase
MESLIELIKKNRAIFDDKEPAEGHFERFEERLNRLASEKQPKRPLKFRFITVFSAAASLFLLIMATIWLYPSPENETEWAEQPDKTEFSVTNRFYAEQMNEKIKRIQCKLSAVSPEIRTQLEEDLHQIVDENEQFVWKMQEENNENLAVFYLVEHYKINLHTLEFISGKLGDDREC